MWRDVGFDDSPRPIVLLHGFGQTGRCWGAFGDALAAAGPVTALDLPGHGAASAVMADLPTTADLVAESIDEPSVVIGYSFGGRVALHLAVRHPDRVAALVLVSATAGIDDEAERAARVAADEALAARIEAEGVDAFVDEWLGLPMFAGLDEATQFVDERRSNSALGLSSSLRLAGTGAQEPLWDRLRALTMPVLVVAGQDDTKFAAIAEQLAAGIGPTATLAVVGGSGHSVHLEQPAATADLVTAWIGALKR
ncbi:MAG: alpha/beta fold hydrolase [Acidimicrobiales bacterium]